MIPRITLRKALADRAARWSVRRRELESVGHSADRGHGRRADCRRAPGVQAVHWTPGARAGPTRRRVRRRDRPPRRQEPRHIGVGILPCRLVPAPALVRGERGVCLIVAPTSAKPTSSSTTPTPPFALRRSSLSWSRPHQRELRLKNGIDIEVRASDYRRCAARPSSPSSPTSRLLVFRLQRQPRRRDPQRGSARAGDDRRAAVHDQQSVRAQGRAVARLSKALRPCRRSADHGRER